MIRPLANGTDRADSIRVARLALKHILERDMVDTSVRTVLSDRTVCWIDIENRFIDFGDENIQPIAANRGDYSYTNGGELYREACEIAWEIRSGRNSGLVS